MFLTPEHLGVRINFGPVEPSWIIHPGEAGSNGRDDKDDRSSFVSVY